ncbi:MAG: hypothetical protein ACREP7_18905 [Lysobacter sp.]
MKLNPFNTKQKQTKSDLQSAATSHAQAALDPVATSPIDDLVDLEPLAKWKQDLRRLEHQYQQAQTALVAARRQVSGVDPLPEPDLTWHVQRELLAAAGNADAVAAFDQEHGVDLEAELAAHQRALQGGAEARARVRALEKHLNDIAAQMQVLADGGDYRAVVARIFRPSAERMRERAREFAQAYREMVTMDSVLRGVTRMHQRYTDGSKIEVDDLVLITRRERDNWLSDGIEGIEYEVLRDLNRSYDRYDNDLSTALHHRLEQAGVDSSWISVFHPTSEADGRPVYAPDPNPPKKINSIVTIIH